MSHIFVYGEPRMAENYTKPVLLILTSVTLLLLFGSITNAAQKTTYVLSRAPQLSETITLKAWKPFTEYLSKETGVEIALKIYETRSEFEQDLLNGVSDFSFQNAYYFLMAYKKYGYIALVRDGSSLLEGIIVVRRDSSIKELKELEGKEVVFPSPNAFMASLYSRALIKEKEKIEIVPRYIGSDHGSVYRSVAYGRYPAGGGVSKTLNKEPEDLINNLRVIWRTPGATPHPLIAHPRVPEELREAVVQAILKLTLTEKGRRMLKSVHLDEPVKTDFIKDFKMLDQLGLEKYFVFIK